MTKYRRKFPCALCGEPVIFENVMNGWTVTCGCGTIIQKQSPNLERLDEIPDVIVEKLSFRETCAGAEWDID